MQASVGTYVRAARVCLYICHVTALLWSSRDDRWERGNGGDWDWDWDWGLQGVSGRVSLGGQRERERERICLLAWLYAVCARHCWGQTCLLAGRGSPPLSGGERGANGGLSLGGRSDEVYIRE